jgi:hypothetical protein
MAGPATPTMPIMATRLRRPTSSRVSPRLVSLESIQPTSLRDALPDGAGADRPLTSLPLQAGAAGAGT